MKSSAKSNRTFSFNASEALSVQLVGDFTHWQENPVNLKRQRGGIWKATVLLTPGTYQYRFLVDGQWRDDARCSGRSPNPFGGQNCIREVAP